MMDRRTFLVAGVALAAAPALVKAATPPEVVCRIENFTFDPPEITVPAGTVIRWENADDIPHSVVEKDGVFQSPPLDTGDVFERTFTTAGDVDYFCGFHPHMVGKITVVP
jgi:plastocyanin